MIALIPGENGMSKFLPLTESFNESSFEELALKNEQSPTLILEGSVIAMSRPSKVGRHFRLENEISPPSFPGYVAQSWQSLPTTNGTASLG